MSTATAEIRLACPECQRENEPERIYCHDCGARLDRSALAKTTTTVEAPEVIHRRLSKMFSQRRAKIRHNAANVGKLLIVSAFVALIALMFIPPELPAPKESLMLSSQIALDLERLTQFKRPPQLSYSESDLNDYLGSALRIKKQKLDHPMLKFERAFLRLNDDRVRLTVGRSISGYYPVYASGDFIVKTDNGKLQVAAQGGAIGHLPIHPFLVQKAPFLFGDVISALDRERKLIAHTGSVQLREKSVAFTAPN